MDEKQSYPRSLQARSGSAQWVGREAELTLLQELLTTLTRGTGGCALVEGPPGIGKSSLVTEALSRASRDALQVLRGSADEFCVSLPFQLISEALRPVRVSESLPQQGSLWGASARNPLAAGVQEALAYVERACALRPVVLVVSDLQWADEASLTVLGGLSRLTDQLPLLLLTELTSGSTREEVHQLRRAIRSRGGHGLRLGPLDPKQTVRLAQEFLGVPLAPRLRRLISQTGGNPLYIREVTASFVREQRIEILEGRAELAARAEGDEELPRSLGAAIAGRIGHLSKDTYEVLRTASMLGTTFESAELAAVVGWSAERVGEALGEAAATGVLRDSGTAAEFHAPLLRHALYESMPASVRGLKHRRTAQVLSEGSWPAERVAAHLAAASGAPDEWTLTWLASHATALLYRVPELARDLLQRATDQLSWGDERREPLEAVLAMAAFLRGKLPECEALASRVLASTQDGAHAAEMTWIMGYALLHQGRPAEAVEAVTAAARRWDLPPVWEARLLALQSVILNAVSDETAEAVTREALERGRALGDAQTIAYTCNAKLVRLAMAHDFEGSGRCLEEGLAAAGADPQVADVRLLLLCNSIYHWRNVDRVDLAAQSAREARKLAVEVGTARLGVVIVSTADYAYSTGEWDEAIADLEMVGELPDRYANIMGYGTAAVIQMQRGELAAAQANLDRIGDPDAMIPVARLNSSHQWRARLELAVVQGRRDEILAMLRFIADGHFAGVSEGHPRLLAAAVRIAVRLEEADLAADLVAMARTARQEDSRAVMAAAAQQCQGIHEGDPDALREALEYFRSATRPVDAAECAEDLSVALAEAGETEGARAAMLEAAEGYLALGATGALDRADARWRQVGLRRGVQGSRKRPASGWASLTPTEQRIAELVAEGLSNPDIGERLHTSRRTVQTHVTHILAKLGLRSRNEVARMRADRSAGEAAS
ncbi:AAA family ATPase [Streptomyces sp. NPDC020681]|uniref:helix-turn-helix transcriptional regulator n=1 Tax=Streptomyces sp. NPDC020681 TaxID=3365083 RepID=UPI0037B92508